MILFVDDRVDEFLMLNALVKKQLPDLFIYWVNYLSTAKELLATNIHKFDLVVIDVSGVTLGDFSQEIKKIKDKKIVVTSSILIPINLESGNKFILKENLAKHIIEYYKK